MAGKYKIGSSLVYDFSKNIFIDEGVKVGVESTLGTKPNSGLKVFDRAFKDVSFGPTLHSRIMSWCKAIFSRDGNVEWMGSNLLGTESIKFFDTDRDRFFDEVIAVDEDYLTQSLQNETDFMLDWNVGGDVFNLTCTYLVHRYLPIIGKDKKAYDAIVELLKLLQFKFYSSIYFNFFKGKPVDLPAAEGTYAALSMKFAIKQLGCWGELIRDRAESFVDKSSPHYKSITKFDNSKDIVYFITDLNTRTKQTVKDYYAELDRVRANNNRIGLQSAHVNIDGESIIRDRVNAFATAKDYLLTAASSRQSLYKSELVGVVMEMVPKASPAAFKELLMYTADLPFGKERDNIEKAMTDTLLHAFNFVATKRVSFTDAGGLLGKLRGLYMSPKSTDPIVLELRTSLENYTKRNTHLRNPAALAAMRNALMLYFVLRAISSNIYS